MCIRDSNNIIAVKPAETRGVAVDLEIADGSVSQGSHKIAFVIKALDTNETITEKSIFLVPR